MNQEPDFSTKAVSDLYQVIAEPYAQAFAEVETDEPFLQKLIELLPAGGHILDVGCGTGRISAYYRDHGFLVEGLDLSEAMLAIAKERYPDIPFEQADVRAWKPKEGQTYDGVSFAYMLFHLPKADVGDVLRKASGWLKSGGAILVIVQEGEGAIVVDEPLAKGKTVSLNLYQEKELTDLLTTAGLTICSVTRKVSDMEGEFPFQKLSIVAQKAQRIGEKLLPRPQPRQSRASRGRCRSRRGVCLCSTYKAL